MKNCIVVVIFLILLFGYCQAQTTFRNPIFDENVEVAFPSIFKHQGYYYMTVSNGTVVEALKSPILSNFRNAERREIYRAPPGWIHVRSPRMHYIQGDLYIYFYMSLEEGTSGARMFVIKSMDPCNPLGNWSEQIRLLPEEEVISHKPTVLENNNGDLYLLWTRTEDGKFSLFIARMETPTKVISPGKLLRAPTMEWEMHGREATDGSVILQSHGAIFLIFSASDGYNQNYCLGIMGIDGGRDPMLLSNWWNDVNHCIFARNDVEGVWGTGHASFVKSPDESETWMLYQAFEVPQNWTMRIQKLEWEEMNRPKFPYAMGLNRDLQLPSGE